MTHSADKKQHSGIKNRLEKVKLSFCRKLASTFWVVEQFNL